jgi:hypothetical protein
MAGLIYKFSVRYVHIPAQDIFGMVGRSGGGYNTIWSDWSQQGRSARDKIMQEYEQQLDVLCGHYTKLEASILGEGVRNPVVVTCGTPKKRSINFLPPELRSQSPNQLLLLEASTGGSRLHVCQKHNMEIPCIINDWAGRFSGSPRINNEADARMCYMDQPRGITFSPTLGLVESFEQKKVGYHLGDEWSEDRLMPLRAPLWIGIMNRHGYRLENLPKIVLEVLGRAGIDQSQVNSDE